MNYPYTKRVLENLEKMYPNAGCELDYNSPFELLVAVILSAQCTDKRVNKVTDNLFKIYNTPEQFANLDIETLKPLIFSCGFYKNKAYSLIAAAQTIVTEFNGKVPNNMEDLLKLRGVGRKTANVVLAEAFKIPALPVDTHVLRVSNRLGFSNSKNPDIVEKDLQNALDKSDWIKIHHQMIFHGRYTCHSQNPECEKCLLKQFCKFLNK